MIKLTSELKEDYVCLNTDTEVSLIDKNFVLNRLSKAHIPLMISSLTIREIEVNVHETKKYVNFSIYLSSKKDSKKMIEIHKEMHLIEDLKTNMLIENDILESKNIIINIQEKKIVISSCQNMIIEVKIHQRDSFVRRNVISQFASVVSSEFYAKISYKMKNLSSNKDFLFESFSEISVFIYAHIIDVKTTEVIVRNESSRSMKISRNFKLEVTQKIQYENCFYASQKHHLALQILKKNLLIEELKVESTINQITNDAQHSLKKSRLRSSSENSRIRVFAEQVDDKSEEKIFFEITVYENDVERQKFDKVINEFSNIWKDEEFINVSKKQ